MVTVGDEVSVSNLELHHATSLSIPTFSEVNLRKHILIWAEGWSNWCITLLSIGFKNLYFIRDDHSYLSPLLIKSYDIKLMTMQECMDCLEDNYVIYEDSVALILEGKPERIMQWYSAIMECYDKRAFETICLIFTTRCRTFNQFKGFTWRKIKHAADAGGATTASFQIAYKSHKVWNCVAALPQWTLSELTDASIGGEMYRHL